MVSTLYLISVSFVRTNTLLDLVELSDGKTLPLEFFSLIFTLARRLHVRSILPQYDDVRTHGVYTTTLTPLSITILKVWSRFFEA